MDGLEVRESKGRGRGVFARRRFEKGEVVEECPIIAVIKIDGRPEELECFPYEWSKTKCAIVGGYGSFYNHSYTPNAEIDIKKRKKLVIFKSISSIEAGEEVTFDYNCDKDLGFKVV